MRSGNTLPHARMAMRLRRARVALHDAEQLVAMAGLHGAGLDLSTLAEARRLLLAPKSAEELDEAIRMAARLRQEGVAHLCTQIDTTGPGEPLVVYNTLSWMRDDVAEARIPPPFTRCCVVGPDGHHVPCQSTGQGTVVFEARHVPPLGYAVYHLAAGERPCTPSGELSAGEGYLENDALRVVFNAAGAITSIYDKIAEHEVLPARAACPSFTWADDEALGAPTHIEVLEDGPVRARLRHVHELGTGIVTVDYTLYTLQPRLDVSLRIEGVVGALPLRATLPALLAAEQVRYSLPADHADTPATDWDPARAAEDLGPLWADLSDDELGVSLISDGGLVQRHDAAVLAVLLPMSDAQPEARFCIYPHLDDWRNGTVHLGYQFNLPLIAIEDSNVHGSMPAVHSFATLDVDHVIVTAVRPAPDGESWLVRVAEVHGDSGEAALTFAHRPSAVAECTPEGEMPHGRTGHALHFTVDPWEHRLFRVHF